MCSICYPVYPVTATIPLSPRSSLRTLAVYCLLICLSVDMRAGHCLGEYSVRVVPACSPPRRHCCVCV